MIKNKAESDSFIRRRGFNRMLEGIFTSETPIETIEEFLDKYNYKLYNVRDKAIAKGPFRYKLTRDEVLQVIKDFERFSIFESLAEADEKLVLQGELELTTDFLLRGALSDIKGQSNRIAMETPVYNILNLDLVNGKEPNIPGLKGIIDYICREGLVGMVVEFSLYDVPVGMNKEKLIIWELRNY